VLSNHDVVRTSSRLGSPDRARAALLTMLALPGSAYLYQGEELGLPQVEVRPEHRQDPVFVNGHADGRDGCRVPLPWTTQNADGSACGFSPQDSSAPWLPQPPRWETLSVQAQLDDPGSPLRLTREVLRLRRDLLAGLGSTVEIPELGDELLVIQRPGAQAGSSGLTCVAACGRAPVRLESLGLSGTNVVLCSRADAIVDGALQPDTAAWFVDR
jgi:alpha-glucosidase